MENSEFEVEHQTMIMFFYPPHNPLYRKKALCVISLVWSQGGASVFQIRPELHYLLARTKYKALVLG